MCTLLVHYYTVFKLFATSRYLFVMGILFVAAAASAARISFILSRSANSNAYCVGTKVSDWIVTLRSFCECFWNEYGSTTQSVYLFCFSHAFKETATTLTLILQNLHSFMACNQNLMFTLDFKSLYTQLYLHVQCNFQCIYNKQTIFSMHFRNFLSRISWLLLWIISVCLFIHSLRFFSQTDIEFLWSHFLSLPISIFIFDTVKWKCLRLLFFLLLLFAASHKTYSVKMNRQSSTHWLFATDIDVPNEWSKGNQSKANQTKQIYYIWKWRENTKAFSHHLFACSESTFILFCVILAFYTSFVAFLFF